GQLNIASDQWRLQALDTAGARLRRGSYLCKRGRLPHAPRASFPAQAYLRQRPIDNCSCRSAIRTRANKNAARRSGLLQACGDVNSIASDEEVAPSSGGAGGHHVACIDSDTYLELRGSRIRGATLFVVAAQSSLHIQRGTDGAHRVAPMRWGDPKHRHDGVADVFLYCAAVAVELVGHG